MASDVTGDYMRDRQGKRNISLAMAAIRRYNAFRNNDRRKGEDGRNAGSARKS